MDVIESFISNYKKQYNFYQKVSQLCAQQCESGLESLGIRTIVTYRAKRPDRLERKIRKRIISGTKYSSADDIYRNIVDLAGVRIALYFPGDREETEKFIASQFEIIRPPRIFPRDSEKSNNRRFSGYTAVHYLVQFRKPTLLSPQRRYLMIPIEIQIASLLMHGWAEVEHDLSYKQLHGTVSEEEHAILDELNGLVLAGELALERLQKAVEKRVGGRKRKFINHYELASYLLEEAKNSQNYLPNEPTMGHADLLYQLLVEAGMDRPDKIAPLIKAMKNFTEQRPITEQITDIILVYKPELYKTYANIRSREHAKGAYFSKSRLQTKKKEQAISFFIDQWIQLEKTLVDLGRMKKPKDSIYSVTSSGYIREIGIFNEMTLKDIDRFRRVRNMLVHGNEIPSSDSLIKEGRSLEKLHKNLKNLSPR